MIDLLPLPKAFIFDLDDTILAFDAVSDEVWSHVCRIFCDKYTICDHFTVLSAINSESSWYWSDPDRHREGRNKLHETRRLLVSRAFEKLGIDRSLSIGLADDYSQRRLDAMYAFPGAIDILDQLFTLEIPMVLLTNGESWLQRYKIEKFGLARFFRAILIEGEMGIGKPDERVYQKASKVLGQTAQDCCIVGDNYEWEIVVPSKMGFQTVWNDFRHKGVPLNALLKPHHVVNSIIQLRTIFEF